MQDLKKERSRHRSGTILLHVLLDLGAELLDVCSFAAVRDRNRPGLHAEDRLHEGAQAVHNLEANLAEAFRLAVVLEGLSWHFRKFKFELLPQLEHIDLV